VPPGKRLVIDQVDGALAVFQNDKPYAALAVFLTGPFTGSRTYPLTTTLVGTLQGSDQHVIHSTMKLVLDPGDRLVGSVNLLGSTDNLVNLQLLVEAHLVDAL
jgi:hypothetical protein